MNSFVRLATVAIGRNVDGVLPAQASARNVTINYYKRDAKTGIAKGPLCAAMVYSGENVVFLLPREPEQRALVVVAFMTILAWRS